MKTRELVDFINDSLQTGLSDSRFTGSVYHNICEYYRNEDGTKLKDVNDSGEGVAVELDNRVPLTIYHLNNGSKTFADPKKQRGDSNDIITEQTTIAMVALASRDKIQISPEELSTVLQAAMPTAYTNTDLSIYTCSISLQSVYYRSLNLWERDNPAQTFLPPSAIMIELSYSIECTYSQKCVDITCC